MVILQFTDKEYKDLLKTLVDATHPQSYKFREELLNPLYNARNKASTNKLIPEGVKGNMQGADELGIFEKFCEEKDNR